MKNITKLIITILTLTLLSTSAKSQIIPTTIQGNIVNTPNYKTISADTVSNNAYVSIATSNIESNGNFKLVLFITETNIVRLTINDNNFITMIVSPGENIVVNNASPVFGINSEISGSEHTQLLYSVMNNVRVYDIAEDSLRRAYNQAIAIPDTTLSKQIWTEILNNHDKRRFFITSEINKNPSSLAWLFLFDRLDINNDFNTISQAASAIVKAHPNNNYAKFFENKIAILRKTAVGSPAPEIDLPDPNGTYIKLSDLKGKIVLLDFWASWCMPCRKANPQVVQLYEKYKDFGFDVYSVSLDRTKDDWVNAIAKDKLSWKNHVSDLKYWKSEAALNYGVISIPHTFIIDKEGKIAAKNLMGDDLENKIKELINNK
ncbi:MAG: TlpA disulfide reductase family protein [Lentimicrobiaceae bacterium]|nr:TlpA disulfide reductase family protein [Lentimicrobiaceae bacterium]